MQNEYPTSESQRLDPALCSLMMLFDIYLLNATVNRLSGRDCVFVQL